jgi:hypothetical protein
MLIFEKDGKWYKVEKTDINQEVYKVSGVSPALATDGVIYNSKKSEIEVITFEESKKYKQHYVNETRFR